MLPICVALKVTLGDKYRKGVPECAVVPIITFTSSWSCAQIWPTCFWRIEPSRTSHSCGLPAEVTSLFSGRPILFMYHVSGTAFMSSSAVLFFKHVTILHPVELRNCSLRPSDLSNSLPGNIALPLDIHILENRSLVRREPISVVTRVPPALCPHRVTDDLLPPKCSMFNCTHWSAAMMSDNP